MLTYLESILESRGAASVSVRFVGEHAATTYTLSAVDGIGAVLAPDGEHIASAYPWHMIASIEPGA
jgi:hypothetical protein